MAFAYCFLQISRIIGVYTYVDCRYIQMLLDIGLNPRVLIFINFFVYFIFLNNLYCNPNLLILDDISEDGEQEFVDSIQKEESTSTRESSPIKETLKESLLNRFSSKFSTNSPSTVNQTNSGTSVSINDGDLVPILSTEKSSPDLNLQESENQKGAAGGNDIGWGSVCFDFPSTNVVQLSMSSKVA